MAALGLGIVTVHDVRTVGLKDVQTVCRIVYQQRHASQYTTQKHARENVCVVEVVYVYKCTGDGARNNRQHAPHKIANRQLNLVPSVTSLYIFGPALRTYCDPRLLAACNQRSQYWGPCLTPHDGNMASRMTSRIRPKKHVPWAKTPPCLSMRSPLRVCLGRWSCCPGGLSSLMALPSWRRSLRKSWRQ